MLHAQAVRLTMMEHNELRDWAASAVAACHGQLPPSPQPISYIGCLHWLPDAAGWLVPDAAGWLAA